MVGPLSHYGQILDGFALTKPLFHLIPRVVCSYLKPSLVTGPHDYIQVFLFIPYLQFINHVTFSVGKR